MRPFPAGFLFGTATSATQVEGHCTTTDWYDFAREIFRQTQIDCTVLSGTSDMLDRPAPRPPFSALVSERADAPQLPIKVTQTIVLLSSAGQQRSRQYEPAVKYFRDFSVR